MRRRPPDGLDQVIAAAVRVFADKGYHRTQMAEVAREMGVAPGTLYGYVTGKEALFHLVIDRAFTTGVRPAAPPLPIAAPPPGTTLARLRERLTADAAIPALEAALRRRGDDPAKELEAVVGELYDRIAHAWPAIVIVERSALEWPELAQVFYGDMRRKLLERLERYLAARMRAGLLRTAPSEAGAALFILETAAWFAMHRHGHSEAAAIDDATARRTVVSLLVNAFVPAARQRRAPRKEPQR